MIWLIFFSSFVFTWLIARYIRRRAIAQYQKTQQSPITADVRILPDGGGLSVVAVWYACTSALAIIEPAIVPFRLFLALSPGILLVVAILMEERYHLHPAFRMMVKAAVTAVSIYLLGGVNSNVFGEHLWDNQYSLVVMNIFAFLAGFGLINVFRFYDGTDGKEGQLGAVTMAICLMFIIISPVNNALFFLIPCLGGFLVLNWSPARVLMGDATASFLGFVMSTMAVFYQSDVFEREITVPGHGVVDLHIPYLLSLTMLIVPVFDVAYTCVRRLVAGDSIFQPTRNHLYQRLHHSGLSLHKVIFIQLGLCLAVFALVFAASWFRTTLVTAVATILTLLLMAGYAAWVEKLHPFQKGK